MERFPRRDPRLSGKNVQKVPDIIGSIWRKKWLLSQKSNDIMYAIWRFDDLEDNFSSN